jgi:phosphatidylglycerol lysyltransferase
MIQVTERIMASPTSYKPIAVFLHNVMPRNVGFLIAVAIFCAAVLLALSLVRKAGLWRERFIPPILAGLTALMGLLDIIAALVPSRLSARLFILENNLPFALRHGSHLAISLAGVGLVAISFGLARRKKSAWLITIVLLLTSIAAQMGKALNWEEASIALSLIALFIAARPSFHTLSDRPSLKQGMVFLIGTIIALIGYGLLGFGALAAKQHIRMGLIQDLLAILGQVVFGDPSPYAVVTKQDFLFLDSLSAIAYIGAGISLFLLLRPVLLRAGSGAADRSRAAEIVGRYGLSALDEYALFEDKSYVFTPQGSCLGFTLVGRRAITLGGPIGPREDRALAFGAFVKECKLNDWEPILYQAGESDLPLLAAVGLGSAICVGHDAIVDLSGWTMAGKKAQDFRTAINRLNKAGHRIIISRPPHPAHFVDSLREPSEEWLTARGGFEQRFASGRFDERYLDGCVIAAVIDPSGTPRAFANLLREGPKGMAVDLMRSGARAEKGSMDALFATILDWAKAEGCERFSFGLSALTGLGEHPDDPAFEKILARVTPRLESFYGYNGLHAFKEKFSPAWVPRYLVCKSLSSAPAALAAIAEAHVGQRLFSFWLGRFFPYK